MSYIGGLSSYKMGVTSSLIDKEAVFGQPFLAERIPMTGQDILSHVDHTLLKPTATWEDIEALCQEAIQYGAASVCIPPSYVKAAADKFGENLRIGTVIGFPLGYSTTSAKGEEMQEAIEDGASEIDMVININQVKNGNFAAVAQEIASLREGMRAAAMMQKMIGAEVRDTVLKVIVEACYLTQEEKIKVCHAVTDAGADYIKTSTGFGPSGATLEDVKLFKEHIGPHVKIKAAGGIRTIEEMKAYLEAGCDRIGSSAAVGLLKDRLEENV